MVSTAAIIAAGEARAAQVAAMPRTQLIRGVNGMDGKHTPGPWLMEATDSGAIVYTLRATQWNGLPMLENAWQAQFSRDGGRKTPMSEVHANARVATAAPELLVACRAALGWFSGDELTVHDLCNMLKAAIAKAEGAGE